MTNLFSKIFLLILLITSPSLLRSQPDDLKDIELNQEQWEAVRDTFAIYAIKHLARLDTLSMQIDSLKKVNDMAENYDCEKELYALVGATKDDVSNFRKKFEETEKKINSKIGTPDDARKMYFNEISASKIRCLPEFSDRFFSMKKKLDEFAPTTIDNSAYLVVKGDCLWKISERKYNTPYLWPAIWDANKNSIANPEKFEDGAYQKINNPDLIYPGQALKIPSVSDEERKKADERSKSFRKTRKP